jgi:tryptophan-rich sensory protein
MIFVIVGPLLLITAGVAFRRNRLWGVNPFSLVRDRRAVVVVAVGAAAANIGTLAFTPANVTSTVVMSLIWFMIAGSITRYVRPRNTPSAD